MNNSHARILEDIAGLLRADVVPALADGNLRAQVFGAIYMLENLRLRIDWAPEPARSQVAAQDVFFDTLRTLGGPIAARLPYTPRVDTDEANTLRDEGDALISTLISERAVPDGARTALLTCLRAQVDAEMRHTARAMFAEMASGEAPQV